MLSKLNTEKNIDSIHSLLLRKLTAKRAMSNLYIGSAVIFVYFLMASLIRLACILINFNITIKQILGYEILVLVLIAFLTSTYRIFNGRE